MMRNPVLDRMAGPFDDWDETLDEEARRILGE